MGLDNVKSIFLVLSGKGGVGKSTMTVEIAKALAKKGAKVGVLDIDLTGPSIPEMFSLSYAQVSQSPLGWIPVQVDMAKMESRKSEQTVTNDNDESVSGDASGPGSICIMSIAFLLSSKNDAVIWRGPKKTAMIRQFVSDVHWGQLDYLVIDTPPGTSDEHLSVLEALRDSHRPDGAILVTTPQEVALADVRKELNFCRKVGLNVLGLIENMSGYQCPHCSECSWIFSKGGGKRLAEKENIPFLGQIPIQLHNQRAFEMESIAHYITSSTS